MKSGNNLGITFTGERLVPGVAGIRDETVYHHYARYWLASQYVDSKMRVIDCGCGVGYGSPILAQHSLFVYGIDKDSAAINYAKTHYQSHNVEFLVCSLTKLEEQFPLAYFDVAVCFEVVEHLSNEERKDFYNQLKRILKPTGKLILSTPRDAKLGKNPFHHSQLSYSQLIAELQSISKSVVIIGQDWNTGRFLSVSKNLDSTNSSFYIAVCDVLNKYKEKVHNFQRQKICKKDTDILREYLNSLRIFTETGLYESSFITHINQLMVLFSQPASPPEIYILAEILTLRAHILMNQGALSSSMGSFAVAGRALKLWRMINNKSGIVRTLNIIGICHRICGNSSKALKNYFTSLKLIEGSHPDLEVAVLRHIGSELVSLRLYEQANLKLVKSIVFAEELGNKTDVVIGREKLGRAHCEEGNLNMAEITLQDCLKTLSPDHKIGKATLLNALADLYIKAKQLDATAKIISEDLEPLCNYYGFKDQLRKAKRKWQLIDKMAN